MNEQVCHCGTCQEGQVMCSYPTFPIPTDIKVLEADLEALQDKYEPNWLGKLCDAILLKFGYARKRRDAIAELHQALHIGSPIHTKKREVFYRPVDYSKYAAEHEADVKLVLETEHARDLKPQD